MIKRPATLDEIDQIVEGLEEDCRLVEFKVGDGLQYIEGRVTNVLARSGIMIVDDLNGGVLEIAMMVDETIH